MGIVREELSELDIEVSKATRDELELIGLLEEMADNLIGILYLMQIFNVSQADLDKAVAIKLERERERTKERIRKKLNPLKSLSVIDPEHAKFFVFLPDGTFITFNEEEDEKIIDLLNILTEEEKEKTEIYISTKFDNGGGRSFVLSSDGRYLDLSDSRNIDIPFEVAKEINTEGCQVIMAWQYDIPIGTIVYKVSENIKGIVTEREVRPMGIRYKIVDVFNESYFAYDSTLELVD